MPKREIIYGILLIYIQILFIPALTLGSATPNLLITYIIFNGMKLELSWSIPIAFLVGVGVDLHYPELFGLNAFILILLTFLVSRFHNNINKEKFYSSAGSILLLNVIYYSFYFIYQILHNAELIQFSIFSLSVLFYNTIFTIIFVYLFTFLSRVHLKLDV